MLISYEAFRALVTYRHSRKNKKILSGTDKKEIAKVETVEVKVQRYLLNPDADLLVCDEGHTIKNNNSATNLAVNKITTKRRIILTGTPIQNNL